MIDSARLIRLRYEANLSQRGLAKKIGANHRSISDWESGHHECRSLSLIRLCRVFNVSADYLLGLTDKKERVYESRDKCT